MGDAILGQYANAKRRRSPFSRQRLSMFKKNATQPSATVPSENNQVGYVGVFLSGFIRLLRRDPGQNRHEARHRVVLFGYEDSARRSSASLKKEC